MYQILQVFTVCLFVGTSWAVFYIPGSVVSYPKMGKRAFYTNATGNRYPLMGRRSSPTNDGLETKPASGIMGALLQGNGEFAKRGVFTKGPHRSYPRVGRSEGASQASDVTVDGKIRGEILKNLAERLNRNVIGMLEGANIDSFVKSESGEVAMDGPVASESQLPQFLFLIFDEDGDNQLSKGEFTNGILKVLEQNLLC